MPGTSATTPQQFNTMCRRWRRFRKLSQLELALAANVSQRHVSWLETGRSQPSREMVTKLSEAMDIPLRERNALFQSAGFAALYRESSLDEPAMAPVLDALNHILKHHEPLPAFAVDRLWNVKKQNRAAELMFSAAGVENDMPEINGHAPDSNLALLTLHPEGLRRFIVNWEQAAPAFVSRLRSEAMSSADPLLHRELNRYIEIAGLGVQTEPSTAQLLPILPLELDINGLQLKLFSVISTFGTPQDITTDELRIEAFYALDDSTRAFFQGIQ
ncbi:MAG: helix-turn-helix domain-containing protein [Pseudomonadota bacterium]